jgi:hypothetical protein
MDLKREQNCIIFWEFPSTWSYNVIETDREEEEEEEEEEDVEKEKEKQAEN